MKCTNIFYLIASLIFQLSAFAQPDFNSIDSINVNKEIDSLKTVYKMDEGRAILIGLENGTDRSAIVEAFNHMNAEQMAAVMKNRLHQALTVPSLSMLQKRIILWSMKKINPILYDHNNPNRKQEVDKIASEMLTVVSKYFSEQQICLLYTECSLRGIEK